MVIGKTVAGNRYVVNPIHVSIQYAVAVHAGFSLERVICILSSLIFAHLFLLRPHYTTPLEPGFDRILTNLTKDNI